MYVGFNKASRLMRLNRMNDDARGFGSSDSLVIPLINSLSRVN